MCVLTLMWRSLLWTCGCRACAGLCKHSPAARGRACAGQCMHRPVARPPKLPACFPHDIGRRGVVELWVSCFRRAVHARLGSTRTCLCRAVHALPGGTSPRIPLFPRCFARGGGGGASLRHGVCSFRCGGFDHTLHTPHPRRSGGGGGVAAAGACWRRRPTLPLPYPDVPCAGCCGGDDVGGGDDIGASGGGGGGPWQCDGSVAVAAGAPIKCNI